MTASSFENRCGWGLLRLALFSFLFAGQTCLSQGHAPTRLPLVFATTARGGAVARVNEDLDSYQYLAEFVADKFPEATMQKLTKTLERMASAQQTFKGLDGAAHEAYQRTHRSGEDIDTSVSGRAQRSAARLAATAEGLLACELVEMVEDPSVVSEEGLAGREVLLNLTLSESNVKLGKSSVAVLILYEPSYDGGAGLDHGTIISLAESSPRRGGTPKGRLLVVVGDTVSGDLVELLSILNQKPKRIKLSSGLVTEEVASVQPALYKAAGDLLTEVEPHLRKYNTTAIHFVGRSLAGGVASLAANMLDGTVPLPKTKQEQKKKTKMKEPTELVEDLKEGTNVTAEPEILPLSGLGRARSSATTLGAPPCLSSNVLAAFCTSFLYGDDVVVRATSDSINRLYGRIQRNLKGGFVGRNIGWMSDTISLTVSSLQSQAHGSEGEEANLSVPGRAYLVRPRRLGGLCSIHEVGNFNKGGREALRANLFWQLQDVLLSKSMWRHHKLESYIHGLDRVQLRGNTDETEEEAMY
jgi:hypothetical protein